MKNGDEVTIKGRVNQIHEDGSCWILLPTGQSLYTDQRNCAIVVVPELETSSAEAEPVEEPLADEALETTSDTIVEAPVETELSAESEPAPIPDDRPGFAPPPNQDGLDRKHTKTLLEICAAEGVTFQPSMDKARLIQAIRAHRSQNA